MPNIKVFPSPGRNGNTLVVAVFFVVRMAPTFHNIICRHHHRAASAWLHGRKATHFVSATDTEADGR